MGRSKEWYQQLVQEGSVIISGHGKTAKRLHDAGMDFTIAVLEELSKEAEYPCPEDFQFRIQEYIKGLKSKKHVNSNDREQPDAH